MVILVTGSNGFIGKNLVANLLTRQEHEILCFDLHTPRELLKDYAKRCQFVFHLAGVNRPKDESEFMDGNRDFTAQLLDDLKECGNKCPVLLSSSIQAQSKNAYGESKLASEEIVAKYAQECGVTTMIYRLPNVFGKWCAPNYNSVVATFCSNIANGLPITVNDKEIVLNLVYIDDVIAEFIGALDNNEHREGEYCYVPRDYKATLGDIASLLQEFKSFRENYMIPRLESDFIKVLYSTYISYLPEDSLGYCPVISADARGSFTELLKSRASGQISVNIAKPGITKGEHWHNSKLEKFIILSGQGEIKLRKIGTDKVIGIKPEVGNMEIIDIPPGYTHNISNIGKDDLITLMWCNECFNPQNPDTYSEKV